MKRLGLLLGLMLALLPGGLGCDAKAAWSAVVDGAYTAVSDITTNAITSVVQQLLGLGSGTPDSQG
jgi:hypothetical protein